MKCMITVGALAASLLVAGPTEAKVTTIEPYGAKTVSGKVTGMRVLGLQPYVSRIRPYARFTGGPYRGQMCWGPPRSDGCSVAVSGRRVNNLIGYRVRVRGRA